MFYKGLYYVLILDKVDNFILVYLVIDGVYEVDYFLIYRE